MERMGSQNAGLVVAGKDDGVWAAGIKKYLQPHFSFVDIEAFTSVPSTNLLLRDRAMKGEREGKVIVAAAQTAGRGKMGRKFFSPPGSGVYFSVLLRPQLPVAKAALIGSEALVAVCEAIETISGVVPQIKGANDVLIKGRKVCGILTENAISAAGKLPAFVIVGIGINIFPPQEGFPDEIKEIAGSVFDRYHDGDLKNRLVAQILTNFMTRYQALLAK